jgi:hypothetical protein
MDPVLLREYEAKLGDWLAQGYRLLADDIDGELRLTAHYVSHDGAVGKEREQEYWPQTPEIVQLLSGNGIIISKALAGPRPWVGPHPEER